MSFGKKLLSTLFMILPICLLAQTGLYSYQDLSHFYYEKQKDSIKKAWTCPDAFKDKAAQKKYKEIWDERTGGITAAITHDDYVHEKEVYGYIDDILLQIADANKQLIPVRPFLLVDRDPSANAYAMGGNILAVNLGLITFARSREDIALTIAHELSHNILHHYETAMLQKAEWLSSDEYKKSLDAVLDSKYERLSRLKKVVEGYTFSRSRHQRFKESDADSLAVILLKKSNIAFNATFFLHLDSSDLQLRHPLAHPLRDYFAAYHLPFEESWAQKRSKGLSTRTYAFNDNSTIEDSVKTHPDCVDRYARLKDQSTPGAKLTPIPAGIRNKVNKMLVWNMYGAGQLTPCLYRILLLKDEGAADPWYDFMVSNIISELYYSDRRLARFNAIGVMPKEYIARDYYNLQTLLEQIPRDDLKQYCQSMQEQAFWKGMPPAERDLKTLLYTLTFDPDDSDRNRARAAHAFATGNATSMYCEFAENFEKK
jgi:Zn-dependent protease with chaperone function